MLACSPLVSVDRYMAEVVEPRIQAAFADSEDLDEIRNLQRRVAFHMEAIQEAEARAEGKSLPEREVEPGLAVMTPSVRANDPDLSPVELAKLHGVEDQLRLIALERWYASNPPERRRLPHVLAQRDKLLGVAITGDRQMLDRHVPSVITGGPPDGGQLISGDDAIEYGLAEEHGGHE